MKFIKEKEKDNSIFSYRVFPSIYRVPEYSRANSWTWHFQIIEGYTGVRNKLYSDFIQNVSLDNRLLDIMNVKYIALDRNVIAYEQLAPGMKLGEFIINYVDNKIIVLENPRMRQRVHIVYNYAVVPSSDVFTKLKSPEFNPLKTIILEENPEGAQISNTPDIEAKINKKNIDSDYYDLEIEMPKPGFAVFSDTYYPGWEAYIDGKETKIYKTDYLVRSIYVPQGKHEIKMQFKPTPFITGAWISGITLLTLIVIAGLKFTGKFEI